MEFKTIWTDLSPEIKKRFDSNSRTLNFKRGDLVYKQGDDSKGIYFIISGLIGLTKIATSGKEHLLRFFRQGQFFGHRSLFSDEPYHGTAIALEPTTVKIVPKEIILEVVKNNPSLLFDVVQVLSKELRRCENQHVMILDNQINARVAQAIIYLKDLHPDHHWTRQEIANFCASTVSTVIKSLAELENMGFVEQAGRHIKILNRDKLISLQDESY